MQMISYLFSLIVLFSFPTFLVYAQSEDIDSLLVKGDKFLDFKKYEDAISIYDEILEVRPSHLEALAKKGDALEQLGYVDEALSYFERVFEINPNYSDNLEVRYFDKVLVIDPNNVLALSKKGQYLIEQDNLEEALLNLDKALSIDPSHEDSLSSKGEVLAKLGNSQEAISYFDKALNIDPKHVHALSKKGDELAKLGNSEEALLYFERVLKIAPYTRDPSGLAYYDIVLEINPNNIEALFAKGNSNIFYDNLLEVAISYYDKIIDIEPMHYSALSKKGEALVRLGNAEEAIPYFDKALKINPDHVETLSKKGDALVKLDNFQEGINYFDKALKIDPKHVDTLYKKGDSYRDQGNYDEAFTYYYKVLELEPTHSLAVIKSQIVSASFGHKLLDGFIDVIIRDSQGRLVGYFRDSEIGILKHEVAENMIDNWNVTKTINRNGTDYEIHQYERVKESGRDGNIWGGAKHYGIQIPNNNNVWLVYANYWMYLPSKGDTITYVYSVFRPVS